MEANEQQRSENFQEYLHLLKNPDYMDVTFDDKSGGVSAIHRNHRLDKQQSPSGEKRGNYEIKTIDLFRKIGHSMILLGESTEFGLKQHDGLLDGIPCEIKAVEQMGRWTIRTKIGNAVKQGAAIIVLYFSRAVLFSEERVNDGWKDYLCMPTRRKTFRISGFSA